MSNTNECLPVIVEVDTIDSTPIRVGRRRKIRMKRARCFRPRGRAFTIIMAGICITSLITDIIITIKAIIFRRIRRGRMAVLGRRSRNAEEGRRKSADCSTHPTHPRRKKRTLLAVILGVPISSTAAAGRNEGARINAVRIENEVRRLAVCSMIR